MQTTDIKLQINMGFMDGKKERRMPEPEAQANLSGLIQHMKDILPYTYDLDLHTPVQSISLASLDLGEWTLTNGQFGPDTTTITYTIQLTITLCHEAPVSFPTIQTIIDAIYESGANFPFTPDAEDALPYTFLYPYHSTIADLHNGNDDSDSDSDD